MNRRMVICIFTGFSSGLPLFVLIQLVPAWLREEGVSLTTIGFLALLQMPFAWKFLWAPYLDYWMPPILGRRRGWILISQLVLLVTIGLLGSFQPAQSTVLVAGLLLGVAFFSASQDIVLDAYRRELLPDVELGIGNAIHVQAYRVAGLIPGSLSLVLADQLPWNSVFWITAAFMLVGVGMTLTIAESDVEDSPAKSLVEAVVLPIQEYIQRKGWHQLLLVLFFLCLYKLGDSMATALSTVFYLDMGFTKTQIGIVAKNASLWPAIFGGLLGGVLMIRLGINRALWLFGVVQVVSILGFAVLANSAAELWILAAVVAFEYLGVGLGTSAFIAFIARETSRTFAASQFALFTALAALPRIVASAGSGYAADSFGWSNFFLLCALFAIPGMLLLPWVAPWRKDVSPTQKNPPQAL